MLRRTLALALALMMGALPVTASETREISGEIMVFERMALPEDTVILIDVSNANDESVASLRDITGGAQSPFPFTIEAPADELLVLRAGLRAGDEMFWLTEPRGIAPGTEPVILGAIRAQRTPLMGYASLLSCGNQLIEIGFLPEEVRLRFNEQLIELQIQPSASGTYYVAADNPATSIHIKGDSAILRIDGAELSECTLIRPDADITQGVWNISAFGETPALFPSRTELVFYPDGRISATVGCNRMIGGYRRHGGILSIGQMATTLMACPDGLAEQEQSFIGALTKVDGYRLDPEGGRLTLLANGAPVIQARK